MKLPLLNGFFASLAEVAYYNFSVGKYLVNNCLQILVDRQSRVLIAPGKFYAPVGIKIEFFYNCNVST